MNLLLRTRRLVAANLYDWFDRIQSPEQLARHALRELAESIERATSALARSLVAERLLERRRDQQERAAEAWKNRAGNAVRAGDEAVARQALERAFEVSRTTAECDRQLTETRAINAELRRQLAAMRDRHQQAGEQLSLHAARQTVSAAAREFAATGSAGASTPATFSGLQPLLDQAERSALESEVELELSRDLAGEGDARADARAREQFIRDELERLRAK